MKLLHTTLRLCVSAVLLLQIAQAQTSAPGAPGKDAQWATAAKQAIGTSATPESKVWFTLAQGVMTEVYYPNVTVANVHLLQFVVVDQKTKKVETERDDANHDIKEDCSQSYTRDSSGRLKPILFPPPGAFCSLRFYQINTAKSGEWTIVKDYVTDPKANTVLINVQFKTKNPELKLYVYFVPSLGNTGMHDDAWSEDQALLAKDGEVSSALVTNETLSEISNGYFQVSDGLEQLRRSGTIANTYSKAVNGNVVQIARVGNRSVDLPVFTLALGFGKTPAEAEQTARSSLKLGMVDPSNEYMDGWMDYLKTLPKVDPKYQAQFNMAAMVLKAQEDKTVRGANVASLTIPWGGGANANEDVGGGSHLVWARDLYHVFTAYMALDDKAAAGRALDFLFNIQQKEDGSFPQNSWLDGKRGWGSLQLDEVGYPLIMAYQLGRFDKATYQNHVKRAADFLVKNGPRTPQERWEEEAGYSPSTITAEIAGLVCAAEIAKRNGDEASSIIYLATADDWARNVERWTATTTGKFDDGNYYLRITQNGNPDAGDKIELNNGAGIFDEREILDAGFLELVRLGIKPADDPLIAKSAKIIDQQIKVATPNGESFYRYSHDGYGEMDDGRRWNWDGKYTGKGRLWALLTGERGQYELAQCTQAETRPVGSVPRSNQSDCSNTARTRLDAMLAFSNEGLMIPEQIWDKPETPKNYDHEWVPDLKFGEGTGSATPLAWSMGQFIRLATNLKAGRNLETPDIVFNRYAKTGTVPSQTSNFGGPDADVVLPMKPGETMKLTRDAAPGTKLAYRLAYGETKLAVADDKGKVTLEFTVPPDDTTGYVGVLAPDGSTAFERVMLRTKPKAQTFSPALIDKIKAAKQSPLITADGMAVIFYRGTAQNVQLAGDLTSWNPGRIFLQKIADDLWAVQLDLPPTARSEYKIIVDGKWILDPDNPNTIDNGVGDRNNYFTMPGYRPNELANGEEPKLDEFDIQSKNFGPRHIKVYVPKSAGYHRSEPPASAGGFRDRHQEDSSDSPAKAGKRPTAPVNPTSNSGPSPKNPPADAGGSDLPVLYLQDGSDYVRRAGATHVLDNLIKQDRVKPFILVFIDPKDRTKEYWANDQWADFVANEVVPEIDKRYHTIKDRNGRATLGASLGGVTSLWIGLKHPDKFARLGGQSSSFWVDNERVPREIAKLDPAATKFRFYLDDGQFEGTDDTRRINVMLRGKGYPVTYVEAATGHNWTSWRDRLAEAFVALWK
jgi:glucoamylase